MSRLIRGVFIMKLFSFGISFDSLGNGTDSKNGDMLWRKFNLKANLSFKTIIYS